jgi:hypothetical protein
VEFRGLWRCVRLGNISRMLVSGTERRRQGGESLPGSSILAGVVEYSER